MAPGDLIQVGYALHRIKEVEFFFKDPPSEFQLNFKPDQLVIDIDTKFAKMPDIKVFGILLIITYSYKDESDKEHPILIHKSIHEYKIANFEKVVKMENKKTQILDGFLMDIFEVSTSTARGLIFNKVNHTFLSQHPLPIILGSTWIDSIRKKEKLRSKTK